MSFWNNLGSYVGFGSQRVDLIDDLATPYDESRLMGGVDVYTFGTGSTYVLTNKAYEGAVEAKRVYFLSWKIDDITEVTFEQLNGYDYFLTSKFTGCRFVVTDRNVAHIAWSAGGNREAGLGTQALRDRAEYDTLEYATKPPTLRRKLSFTTETSALDTAISASGRRTDGGSYFGNSAMIFGHRVDKIWRFKKLEYTADGKFGVWSNFI
jgi:hypothetical protein